MENTMTFGQVRLEKIVLINSSSFKYAEIPVFGNTHISGTNSTGKTTVTQALTVFYTGDTSKDKLGIDASKKPFLDYNLTSPSSYIIYEVRRSDADSDRFLVVLRKSGGLTFYFFDCPYSPSLFINKDGYAYNSIERVKDAARETFGHEIDSRSVKGKDKYIDVLYGYKNNRELVGGDRSWTKFSLVTCSGLDRPHTKFVKLVQMMLLLGNMQGDVVKDMIVSTLDNVPDDFPVDLWASRTRDARNRKNVIRTWLRDPRLIQDRTRYQKAYADLAEEKRNYLLYPAMAKYAREEAVSAKKETEKERDAALAALDKTKADIELKRQAREAVMEQITKKIGSLESSLDDAARKRHESADLVPHLGILSNGEQLKQNLELSKANLKAITEKNADISSEAERMKADIDAALDKAAIEAGREKAEKRAAREAEKGRIREDEAVNGAREKVLFDQRSDVIEAKRESALADLDAARQKEASATVWRPKGKEIEEIKAKIDFMERQAESLLREKAALEKDAAVKEAGKEGAANAIRLEFSDRIKDTSARITELQVKEEDLKAQLDSFEKSLAQWLDANVSGWQSDIGRILPRETLLRHDLKPEWKENGETVYGIAIDLSVLPACDVSPARIREEYEATVGKRRAAKAEHDAAISERDRAVRECTDKIDKETDALRSRALEKEAETARIRSSVQEQKDRLDYTEKEQERMRQEAMKKAKDEIIAAKKALDAADAEKDALRKEIADNEKKAKDKLNERLSKINLLIREDEENIQRQLDLKKKEALKRKEEIDRDLAAILADNEVSRERIEELQSTVRELVEKVAIVNRYALRYIQYKDNERNYFNREKEWRDSLSEKTDELESAKKNDAELRLKEDARIKESAEAVDEKEDDIKAYEESVMRIDEHFSSERHEEFRSCEPYENDLAADEIIRRDDDSKTKQERYENDLERIWRNFRDRLGAEGISDFFPRSAGTEDFISDPASVKEVYDFIVEDRIEQYKEAWNANAMLLVSDIFYQANGFTSGLSKIKETVFGLNALFRRHNFSSVIKKFEMSVEDNKDDVVSAILSAADVHSNYCRDWDETRRDFLDGTPSNERFLGYIDTLANRLMVSNKEKIRLADTFMLFFDAQEGTNRTGKRNNLNHVGSTGIDMLFKEIVYLLILTRIKNRFDYKGETFMIHCPIDEQAKLSADNFNNLITLANDFGVFIFANSPSVPSGTEESFRIANYLWKDEATGHAHARSVLLLEEEGKNEDAS